MMLEYDLYPELPSMLDVLNNYDEYGNSTKEISLVRKQILYFIDANKEDLLVGLVEYCNSFFHQHIQKDYFQEDLARNKMRVIQFVFDLPEEFQKRLVQGWLDKNKQTSKLIYEHLTK